MAFTPEPEFPDFTQLLTSLNNSQISVKNPALYQTIKGLIGKVQGLKGLAQEDIDQINQDITDLSNTVNNFVSRGHGTLPPPWMPVFDGEDGEDGFPIVGPAGKDGLDGKTIPPFCDCEYIEPPPLLPQCCTESDSEVTFTTTGNIDDLDFGNAKLIRMNNASLATIRGLKAGIAGQRVTIVSVGAGQVNFSHQDTNSSALNRLINFVTLGSTPLAAGSGFATYVYDVTTGRWRLNDHEQGAWIDVAFSAGDFTANGAMTCTAAAGDIIVDRFRISGRSMTYSFQYNTMTLGGVANTTIIRAIVGGYTVASASQQPNAVNDNVGTAETGKCFVLAAGTSLNFRRAANANWTLGADVAGVFGVLNLELTYCLVHAHE